MDAEKLLGELVDPQNPSLAIRAVGETSTIGEPEGASQNGSQVTDATEPIQNSAANAHHTHHPMIAYLRLNGFTNYSRRIRLTALDFWGSRDGEFRTAHEPNPVRDKPE